MISYVGERTVLVARVRPRGHRTRSQEHRTGRRRNQSDHEAHRDGYQPSHPLLAVPTPDEIVDGERPRVHALHLTLEQASVIRHRRTLPRL
jgi:hypothetical protein